MELVYPLFRAMLPFFKAIPSVRSDILAIMERHVLETDETDDPTSSAICDTGGYFPCSKRYSILLQIAVGGKYRVDEEHPLFPAMLENFFYLSAILIVEEGVNFVKIQRDFFLQKLSLIHI